MVAAALVFAGAAAIVYTQLPEQLTPNEDRGFIPISVSAPQGVSVDFMDMQMRQIEAAVATAHEERRGDEHVPACRHVQSEFRLRRADARALGATNAERPGDRARAQSEAAEDRRRADIDALGQQPRHPRRRPGPALRHHRQRLRRRSPTRRWSCSSALESEPSFDTVSLNYDTTQPELSVAIDREKASDLGVSVDSLGTTLSTLLDGKEIGKFYVGGDAIPVRVQAPDGMIDDPGDLENVFVRTASGRMVPLASFVTVTEQAVAPELPREGQRRAVPIAATLKPGVDLRHAMNELETVAAQHLAPGMGIRYLGEAAALNETASGVAITFGFALVVVLLVLAAQFESFTSAIIIMFTVPFGLAAAVFAIALSGGSLNIYSQIGLVMLVGIMAKNGILIVEFANQLRERGFRVEDAIREACRIRLRPVVMTMIATDRRRRAAGADGRRGRGGAAGARLDRGRRARLRGRSSRFSSRPVAYLLLARFASRARRRRIASMPSSARSPTPIFSSAASSVVRPTRSRRSRPMLAVSALRVFDGCAPPTFPSRGRLGARDRQTAPAFLRGRGSRAVQDPIRHALLPAFQAGCFVADDEDRSASERAEMRAIAAGDAAAFRRLIDREAPRLLRFAQGLLGSLDEAEDVVQDTLIRLWENAARWTADARIGTWLHRVCYNRAIDRLRRRRAFVDESALEEFADDSEPATRRLFATRRRFRSALRSRDCRRGNARPFCSSMCRDCRSANRRR